MMRLLIAALVCSSTVVGASDVSPSQHTRDSGVPNERKNHKGVDLSVPLEAHVSHRHSESKHRQKHSPSKLSEEEIEKLEQEHQEHKREQRFGYRNPGMTPTQEDMDHPTSAFPIPPAKPDWDRTGKYYNRETSEVNKAIKKHQELGTAAK